MIFMILNIFRHLNVQILLKPIHHSFTSTASRFRQRFQSVVRKNTQSIKRKYHSQIISLTRGREGFQYYFLSPEFSPLLLYFLSYCLHELVLRLVSFQSLLIFYTCNTLNWKYRW